MDKTAEGAGRDAEPADPTAPPATPGESSGLTRRRRAMAATSRLARRRKGAEPADPAAQLATPGEIAESSGLTRRRRAMAATSRLARRRKGAEPADPAAQLATPGEIAEFVGEISESSGLTRRRRATAATSRLARRGSRASWSGVTSSGRWLTSQVLAMAPRLPVRDQQKLRAQFPGLDREELADRLILGASRASASVGAAVGAAMLLPLPSAPVELAFETVALVGIELKLVAELHEVYGMRAPGSAPERMLAYVVAWAHRRGVALVPGGLALAAGSPLRRQLERRLLARAGRSAVSLGPLLTGAAAGALLNRRETGRLGAEVRSDLRRRSPQGPAWPD